MAGDRGRRIVVGIGNPDRGDDAAGRAVARLLRGTLPADVLVVEEGGETTGLMAHLDAAAAAFLVDACVSGGAAGTIRRFDVSRTTLPPAAFAMSSHGIGLPEAIELARALGRLPLTCVVYAVEGESFAIGQPLSPQVARAVGEVAAQLRAEIDGDPR